MDRIQLIQKHVDDIISQMQSDIARKNACIHTYGVAQCCSLLAARRGLDAELAYISGLFHDIYIFKTGISMCHAQSGADMVRVIIRNMDFSSQEKSIIQSAIYHHSNKDLVHNEYDEVLKDADILQRFLNYDCMHIFRFAQNRLENLLDSLNMSTRKELITYNPEDAQAIIKFGRSALGDIAESLAGKKICGEKTDLNFMEIIKYFPETTAFDELTHAWCAAFVYHCVIESGIKLPLRFKPTDDTRFACVAAWLRWGEANQFCYNTKDGFTPSRGDIVIYDNVIPPQNKPANSPWYDHIGIVVSAEPSKIIVAEGNINNENTSGIVERRYDEIGCYVRIPDNYEYDGWKYDYKTGEQIVR